jgi:2-polyprenyl-3-methyl-5-hydroxy-6-metoxy-1,4-benzoquinol methylase
MLRRVVEPEILDRLAPDDPRALRARRDLRFVNALVLQDLVMARTLRRYVTRPPRRLVDLGSGDGSFMLKVARRLGPRWRGTEAILVDAQDAVTAPTRAAFAALGWTVSVAAENVFTFAARAPAAPIDLVIANMFLHHLPEPDLVRLMAQVARMAPQFVVGELRRTRFVRESARFMWLMGVGDVICYDGRISATAAFRDKELSALWPGGEGWRTHEGAVTPWTHFFVAQRDAG